MGPNQLMQTTAVLKLIMEHLKWSESQYRNTCRQTKRR